MATILDESIGGRGWGGLGIGGSGEGGLLAGVLIASLLRRGGIGGDGDCGDGNGKLLEAAILNAVNGITSAVPTTALETQATIAHAISSLALGTQQGFANIKDSVQAASALNLSATNNVNQSVLVTGLQTQIAVGNDGDKTREAIANLSSKIDANTISNLQRELTVAQLESSEERNSRRIREVEVSVSQSVNQTQLQGQAQGQQQQQAQVNAAILTLLHNLQGDLQAVKQGQVIFNSGTMAASGTQAAANTKVA